MVDLIIHPGHPKCGSTSIQKFLLRNRHKLEEKGVFLPDDNFCFSFNKNYRRSVETPRKFFKQILDTENSNQFAGSLSRFKDRVQKLNMLAKEAGCNKIIVSAENLVNKLSSVASSEIHNIFRKEFNDKRVVYFVRRQDDFILSAWQQWEHKRGRKLKKYVQYCKRNKIPNYLKAVRFFEKAYGKNALRVIPLHKKCLINANLFEEFLFQAEIPSEGMNSEEIVANEALNPYLCDILSSMPKVYKDVHDVAIKESLFRITQGASILSNKGKNYLNSNARKEIMSLFRDDNLILHKEYCHRDYDFESVWGDQVLGNKKLLSENEQLKRLLRVFVKAALRGNV
ncbi:MAG: hypothetical protein JXX29_22430 [Deltaproteobacteria bacterium]|nr:hypothetical protein [Deltaproteobacteria bacterium]MBN2674454.1 hypothetical protein [Deltaproteobacteria bacterium]